MEITDSLLDSQDKDTGTWGLRINPLRRVRIELKSQLENWFQFLITQTFIACLMHIKLRK